MRGIRGASAARSTCTGTTPACAGNTAPTLENRVQCGDHPCVCGEYGQRVQPVTLDTGPPLRVRGIPQSSQANRLSIGTTPACAGNTRSAIVDFKDPGDHPCVCGEYLWESHGTKLQMGPPLRVLGIPFLTCRNGRKIPDLDTTSSIWFFKQRTNRNLPSAAYKVNYVSAQRDEEPSNSTYTPAIGRGVSALSLQFKVRNPSRFCKKLEGLCFCLIAPGTPQQTLLPALPYGA